MNHRSLFFAICFILFFGISACTAVPQPTPSPEAAAELVTMPTKRPSATPTLTLTATPIPIATKTISSPSTTPTSTERRGSSPNGPRNPSNSKSTETPIPPKPTNTTTATYTPLPTSTPIAWNLGITELINLDRRNSNPGTFVWSPTQNEFVTYGCPINGETEIYLVDMLNPVKINITPKDLYCYISILWHPSGNYFFFSSESREEWGTIEGWKVNSTTLSLTYLERETYYWGWLNDELRISERRIGTGINNIGIYDVVNEKGVAGTSFDGNAVGTSNNYVILETGTWANSTIAVLAQEEVSPEFEGWLHGTMVKFLGQDSENSLGHPYARYMDALPNSDQVLAYTWEEPIYEETKPADALTGIVSTNLQLWDINTEELTLVKEGGLYGRFSPSGNEILILTATKDGPQLELINRLTNEIFITQPAYATTDDFYVDVYAYTSFSPNGRFLTYYSPEQELIIYDIAFGEFLPSVTAVPMTPVWSPDNGRFVYQDPELGLSIYEIETHATYALTKDGCDDLRNPQWSFDGSYLSVDVPCAGTAVLQLP